MIEEGKTGLFYQPGNADDLVEKISALIDDPDLSGKMGEEGLRVVEEKYRWDKLADEFVRLCEGYRE